MNYSTFTKTQAIEVDTDNILGTLEDNELVVLDFWAPSCPHCKELEPIIDNLAEDYHPPVVFGKVNLESGENEYLAADMQIDSIPTIILFQNSEEVERIVGYHPSLGEEIKVILSSYE